MTSYERKAAPREFFVEDLVRVMDIPFSDQQLAAITAPLRPSLIVAGAGTGKTSVMAGRVVWLVGTGQVELGAVLGCTFTRRAAGELARRIKDAVARLPGVAEDEMPSVFTYDAFVGQLLAGQGLRLGLEATGRLMTGAQPYQLARSAVDDPGFEPDLLRPVSPAVLSERLLALDQQMAGHLASPEAVEETSLAFAAACDLAPGHSRGQYVDVVKAAGVARQRAELVSFVRTYRRLKREAGVVEFADQQAAATRLAAMAPQVGAGLRERFRVVLLDEYQDTSSAQAAMLSALFSGPDTAGGRGHPVSAVGDPLQAIYGWRGAAADNMSDFKRLFPLADGSAPAVFPLAINLRSGAAIIDATNAVARRLGSIDGQAGAHQLVADPARGAARIEATSFDTWPQEVAAVAARLVEARRHGELASWDQAAVLLRRNADIPAFFEALTKLDVPVEIVGIGGLLALPEIAGIVALLRVAADDGDNPATALLVSGPACGLGPRDMAALARRAKRLQGTAGHASLLDAVFDPGGEVSARGAERLARLVARVRTMRRARHEQAVDLVWIAADLLGLSAELDVESAWSASVAPQVRRFASHVADRAGGGDLPLSAMLQWLHEEAVHGGQLDQATPSEADSVKLLTVHKAKGLEWPVVALPALAAGVFPNDRVGGNPLTNSAVLPFELRLDAAALPSLAGVNRDAMGAFEQSLRDDQAASEDRLAYVAVSRARDVLLASTSYWRVGAANPLQPSRLFELIAAQAVASGGVVDLAPDPAGENPLAGHALALPWPTVLPPEDQARLDAVAEAVSTEATDGQPLALVAEDAQRVAGWRASIAREETGQAVPAAMPASVSASALLAAHKDPAAFFSGLARPMPSLADDAMARGIAFHRWVERRFGAAGELDEAPAAGIDDLTSAFEAGPYAQRRPLAIEQPFVAVIAGQQVRGRIDAVYAGETPGHYHLVDWKTSSDAKADPGQLAIYRLAWAQAMGCAVDNVDAVFYYVALNRVVRPPSQRSDVEAWVAALKPAQPGHSSPTA